jgi:hypothetical protein
MKRIIKSLLCFTLLGLAPALLAQSQMKTMHGDFANMKMGLHAGNQIRTTFFNDGTYGCNAANPKGQGGIGGEWPINSGHPYLLDANVFVTSEVIDADGILRHISSTVTSAGNPNNPASSGNYSAGDADLTTGTWWTFMPLPGFANPADSSIAMSKWPYAWPASWPDKSDDAVDPGWAGSWNGYFGKNQFNADEEAFFVSDDYQKKEFNFFPDSTDLSRKGLGMRMWVRSFQWSNALVEDCMYILYDIENIGTTFHNKMAFGYKIGNNVGETNSVYGGEGDDDDGAYSLEEDMAYLWDDDNIGAGGWSPVGWIGGAFLESPGNAVDGIDNDGDAINGSGPVISEATFAPRVVNTGDPIVLIDYTTYERTVSTMPAGGVTVRYIDQTFNFTSGSTLEEVPNNLVDDNLNGIIDENNGTTVGLISRYIYTGLKHINYFTGAGLDNKLIDERRDDGIDNDADWNALLDDTGADGASDTGDPGERDGQPTAGEPHFDKTDISETDMIGLTSFNMYAWTSFAQSDDEAVWAKVRPGQLTETMTRANTELFWGAGYFPMQPGFTQRFSMGLVLGFGLEELTTNKRYMARAYEENYNFAKAPLIPTLNAVPGDGRVTLYWNDVAEKGFDPISGFDFEGYRIYRSTDPGWNDMTPITDGSGSVTYRKPLKQFDLVNGITGYSQVGLRGVQFYLGDDTGIVHSFVDTTAVNGYTYYYAVTSYDRGEGMSIPPSECSRFVSMAADGTIDEKGKNVVVVRPEAPSAGYLPASSPGVALLPGGTTSGRVNLSILDPAMVKPYHVYRIAFEETLKVVRSFADTVFTKNVSLIDQTEGRTLVDKLHWTSQTIKLPLYDGFELTLQNENRLEMDTLNSAWSRDGINSFTCLPYAYREEKEIPLSRDFDIVIGASAGFDTSDAFMRRGRLMPAVPVNFTVLDPVTRERMPFGFIENDGNNGVFSAFTVRAQADEITIVAPDTGSVLLSSWLVRMVNDSLANPAAGDTMHVRLLKPFRAQDVFEFTVVGEDVSDLIATSQLDLIKVVPNPYIVANSFEALNPYADGRGPREIHFTHLPAVCTIKIFNMRGQLVRTLEHNTPSASNGTEIWDVRSKDNLDVAYGVYIFHVDAGKVGQKIGKFAIVK